MMVDAAVTNIEADRAFLAQYDTCNGCAHPGERFILSHCCEQRDIRRRNSILDPALGVKAMLKATQTFDGKLAGDPTGSMSTHSVGQQRPSTIGNSARAAGLNAICS